MASLKGATSLWDGVSVGQNDVSDLALIGPGPWVAIYIHNAGSNTAIFKVQVSATVALEAGRNALDDTVSGGLTWYDYTGPGGDGAETSISVGAGVSVALDLSPFAPPFVRLVRTDNNGADIITAFVSSYGMN